MSYLEVDRRSFPNVGVRVFVVLRSPGPGVEFPRCFCVQGVLVSGPPSLSLEYTIFLRSSFGYNL